MERDSLLYKARRKCQVIAHKIMPDETMCRFYSRILLKKKVDLKNPKTFNEKIQWLKIHDYPTNQLVIDGADKYKVREYVKKKGLGDILVPLIGHWDKPEDIDWDSLPDKFVLKCNHGCAYNILCNDKNKFDKVEATKRLKKWMKEDFGAFNIETHYSQIKPHITCEEFLGDCLIIVVASLFHSASIILMILAFLPRIDFSDRKTLLKWGIISLAVLAFLNIGITKVLSFFPYFQHYYTNSIYSEGGIRSASIAFFAIRFLIVLLVKIIGGFKWQEDNSSDNMSVFDMLLFFDLVVAAASIGFNLFDRLENYFSLGYIIVVVNAICSLNDKDMVQKNNKIIATVLVVTLSFAYMTATVVFRSSWSGIFPYSFV